MRAFRVISFLLWFLFAALLGQQALHMHGLVRDYPGVLILAVMGGMAAMALREFVPGRRDRELPAEVARLLELPAGARMRLLVFVLLWLAYPWLLSHAGFLVTTSATTAVSLALLGIRRIALGALGSVAFAVSLAVLFSTVFYIPTPAGPLDKALTHLLYVASR